MKKQKLHDESFSLHSLLDDGQRRLSLNIQRGLLLLFLLFQALFIGGYLAFVHSRIEYDVGRTLRNAALQEARQFESSVDAMRYQLQDIGNALLLNHTVAPEDVKPFLAQELKRNWLDAVIVFNAQGDIVAKNSISPLGQALSTSTLASGTFRNRPLFLVSAEFEPIFG